MQQTPILDQPRTVVLPRIEDSRGTLSAIEVNKHVPFTIDRVSWTTDTAGLDELRQVLRDSSAKLIVALAGSIEITAKDEKYSAEYSLDHPSKAIYLPRSTLSRLESWSDEAVCLILSSD